MDTIKLQTLIKKPESATLDFKQELKIYITGNGRQRERDELRRDILALTNGNPGVAGEEKHLVIGRADKPNPDGSFELFDIGSQYPTADDLLKMLADVAYPPLNTIYSEPVELDGKRLLVITIPPTEYVHETTRELKTPKRTYTEHTVFMRRDESVAIASASDRAAIRRAKQKFFDERENVNPITYGAGLGALFIAPILAKQAENRYNLGFVGQSYMAVIGGLIGAILGSVFGNALKNYRTMLREWPKYSNRQKTAVSFFIIIYTGVISVIRKIRAGKRVRHEANHEE